MSTITTFFNEQERQGLLSLAQEIEEGHNTVASVSSQYSSPVAKENGATDLASRLVSAANPPFTIAASQIGPLSTGSIVFGSGRIRLPEMMRTGLILDVLAAVIVAIYSLVWVRWVLS